MTLLDARDTLIRWVGDEGLSEEYGAQLVDELIECAFQSAATQLELRPIHSTDAPTLDAAAYLRALARRRAWLR